MSNFTLPHWRDSYVECYCTPSMYNSRSCRAQGKGLAKCLGRACVVYNYTRYNGPNNVFDCQDENQPAWWPTNKPLPPRIPTECTTTGKINPINGILQCCFDRNFCTGVPPTVTLMATTAHHLTTQLSSSSEQHLSKSRGALRNNLQRR